MVLRGHMHGRTLIGMKSGELRTFAWVEHFRVILGESDLSMMLIIESFCCSRKCNVLAVGSIN